MHVYEGRGLSGKRGKLPTSGATINKCKTHQSTGKKYKILTSFKVGIWKLINVYTREQIFCCLL